MEWKKSVITNFVVSVVIIFFIYWYSDVPVLKSQILDLRSQVSDISSQMSQIKTQQIKIESFLAFKYPKYNLSALLELSAEKKIGLDKFNNIIYILEKNPKNSKTYLMNQLGFTASEVNSIFTPHPSESATNPHTENPGPGVER